MTAPNDAKIVSALKENAESGFRLLMAKYKEAVYWHIRRLVVSYDDAQDATQETFIRVFRSFRQFKGECSLAAWIYRIATNEALRISEAGATAFRWTTLKQEQTGSWPTSTWTIAIWKQ